MSDWKTIAIWMAVVIIVILVVLFISTKPKFSSLYTKNTSPECIPIGDEQVCSVNSNDVDALFIVHNNDTVIQDKIRNGRWWEEHLHYIIDDITFNDKIAIDIGANIGTHSIYLAHKAPIVWCFEPQERLFNNLMRNSSINNVSGKVKGFQMALSDTKENTTIMHGEKNDYKNSGGVGICPECSDDSKGEKVKVDTLDNIWKSNGSPAVAFIKIDIEGGEISALKGGHELINSQKPKILFEDHTKEKTVNYIKTLGYSVKHVQAVDFLATPK